jgi:hypothetical protein
MRKKADIWRTQTKGKRTKPRKFWSEGPKWATENMFFQCTGTDGQDENHYLQRSFRSIKNTRTKNGYIC